MSASCCIPFRQSPLLSLATLILRISFLKFKILPDSKVFAPVPLYILRSSNFTCSTSLHFLRVHPLRFYSCRLKFFRYLCARQQYRSFTFILNDVLLSFLVPFLLAALKKFFFNIRLFIPFKTAFDGRYHYIKEKIADPSCHVYPRISLSLFENSPRCTLTIRTTVASSSFG